MKYLFLIHTILLFSSFSFAQSDTSRLASLMDAIRGESKGKSTHLTSLFFNNKEGIDIERFGELFFNEIHKSTRYYQKDILSSKEYSYYKKMRFEVDNSNFSKLTMFEFDEKRNRIVISKNMFVRLINYSFLDLVEVKNFKGYGKLNEIYSSLLQHILQGEMSYNTYSSSIINQSNEYDKAFEVGIAMNLIVNLLFIEMHELYHIVYGGSHMSMGIEEEIRADSFAIGKVYAYFKKPLNQDFANKYLEGYSEPPTEDDILFGLTKATLTFKVVRDYYESKPHLFNNTINDLVKRGLSLMQNIYKVACEEEGLDLESCRTLKNDLDNISYVDRFTSSDILRLQAIDDLPLSNVMNNCNEREFMFKIRMLLFDGEYRRAKMLLEDIIKNYKNRVSNGLYEMSMIVLLNLYDREYDYVKIDNLLDSVDVNYKILPPSYYSLFKREFEDKISHNLFFSNSYNTSYLEVLNKYKSRNFKLTTLNLPFTASLNVLMKPISGKWYGDLDFDYRSMKGNGVFVVNNLAAEVIVEGYLSRDKFLGLISVWTKFEGDSYYLNTTMNKTGPHGYTYIRLEKDSMSILFNFDKGEMRENCYLWLREGNTGVGTCRGCNVFEGDFSNFVPVDSSEYISNTLSIGAEFKFNESTTLVSGCYTIAPSINLLFDKTYVESLQVELPSNTESNVDEIRFVRQHIINQMEKHRGNHAYVYNYTKVLECLDR